MEMENRLSGVFAPITTPFKNDQINYEGLVDNLNKYNQTELSGYFSIGTNGEFKALSTKERLKVLKEIIDNSTGNKIIMACTHAESTNETINVTLEAAKIGADQASLLMPSFFSKYIDEDVMTNYIVDVAEASPIPIVLYNNPSVSNGVSINKEVIKRVSPHENVIGIKDSSKTNYPDYLDNLDKGFYLMAGSASFFYEAMEAGAIGGVLSLANIIPTLCVKLYKLYQNGKVKDAKKLNNKIVSLNRKVSGVKGVASVKKAMDIVGFNGGKPRKPLKTLTEKENKTLYDDIKSSFNFLNI